MASINGLGRSSMSSIYGNRNVISGLASGMDTEAMIENAIAGYKMKISSLQQKQTKVTWQQQALRSIIDKLADFSQKYTSYASSTNLLSSSFFNSSVKVSTHGTYADKVSATGKTNSTVQILGVKQLASAATYKGKLNGVTSDGSIHLGKVDTSQNDITVSNLTGSLTIANGDSDSVTIELTEEDMAGVTDMAGLADKLNAKLEEAEKNGENKGGIRVVNENGTITLKGNNKTYIKSASGKIRDTLNIEPGENATKLSKDDKKPWESKVTWADQVDGKEISITLDGVTKRFTLNAVDDKGNELDYADVMDGLKKEIESAFNKKVTMEGDSSTGGWKLGGADGSTLSVSSSVGKLLGMDSNNETSYTNMNKTLGELGVKFEDAWAQQVAAEDKKNFTEVTEEGPHKGFYKDKDGNLAEKGTDGKLYRVDDKHNRLYNFELNGKTIGSFTKDSTLESVISAINKNSEAGVDVSFSQISNEFQFTSRETGSRGKIEMTGLAAELFGEAGGDVKAEGKDAIFSMAVNGKVFDGISRSGNTFDVDGLQVSLKGTFGDYGTDNALDAMAGKTDDAQKIEAVGDKAVSFTTAADSDKIVDTIKKFAEDYNAMVKEIKDAYSTLPLQKSNGASYEPLTSDELEGMSETEIKNYEEKAKQGLLFGDRDLSNLYNQLTNAFTSNTALKKIGIEVSYSNGLSTLTVNEEKLRTALDSDPEQVQEAFTSAAGNGKTMMESMKETLDRYGSVVGTKGILVERAGSPKAASTLLTNTMQKVIDNFETQIQKWTDKMTDQVDRYTSKFSQLEQLIAQMNAQSSSLSGLMGGF